MKKLFSILIALALLAGVCSPSFALVGAGTVSYTGGTGMGEVRTVTLVNNSTSTTDTVLVQTPQVITSTYTEPGIVAGKVEILGYEINLLANAGPGIYGTASLMDATSWNLADVISEAEAFTGYPCIRIFPNPIRLLFGLYVVQGPYTSVTVYYRQYRP